MLQSLTSVAERQSHWLWDVDIVNLHSVHAILCFQHGVTALLHGLMYHADAFHMCGYEVVHEPTF